MIVVIALPLVRPELETRVNQHVVVELGSRFGTHRQCCHKTRQRAGALARCRARQPQRPLQIHQPQPGRVRHGRSGR